MQHQEYGHQDPGVWSSSLKHGASSWCLYEKGINSRSAKVSPDGLGILEPGSALQPSPPKTLQGTAGHRCGPHPSQPDPAPTDRHQGRQSARRRRTGLAANQVAEPRAAPAWGPHLAANHRSQRARVRRRRRRRRLGPEEA